MPEFFGVPLDARLAAVCLATLVGGFMRGFVGFGAALVTIPVLSLAYEPRLAVAAMSVVGIPTLFQLLPDAIRTSERPIVVPISLAILLSAPLGTWILVHVSPGLMKIVISLLVVIMVAMLMRGWRLEQEVGRPILIGAGVAGGLIQGSAGIGGPPVVGVILSRPGTPVQQRGNVLALMTAVSLSSLLPLLYFGLFTKQAIVTGLLLLPIYGGSILLGSRYFAVGGARHFRHAAMATLALIGIATLIASIRDYLAMHPIPL
ncbi:MAG TPA: sulfite exporter TauE/SafE family protein [Hyphomicrobiaceae bacterium]|nr:sulfite exporter TauE/SafE family protein [Hyphomicrobiaceae bacterium]